MNVRQLDHLNISVSSFDETADWYRRVFGFEVVQDETDADGVRWGVLRAGDAMLCIYEHPELTYEHHREQGRHGINHFGLRITDRAAWEETLQPREAEAQLGRRDTLAALDSVVRERSHRLRNRSGAVGQRRGRVRS